MFEPDGGAPSTGDVHEGLLAEAARVLRANARNLDARPVPAEFATVATARLLEEIGRAVHAGYAFPQHLLDAALEIARHTLSRPGQR